MTPRLFLFLGLFVCAFNQIACAQRTFSDGPTSSSGGPLLPAQAAYDVTFYDLSLDIFPDTKSIDGMLTVHARIVQPLDTFILHLDDRLDVEAVDLLRDDTPTALAFEHREGLIRSMLNQTMQPGEIVSVRVRYGGTPREAPNPPWIGGFTWAETEDGQPWIATSVQGEGADLWWPVKDHPSDEPDSMALHITVPDPLVVASNGRLQSVAAAQDTRTYHWFVSTPINNYGVALNIAPYRTIKGDYQSISGDTVPVTFWVLPEHYEQGAKLFPQFAEHLAFYEKHLGPYPFRADKYGVAETPHLGMEHQTIIAYGSDFSDEPNGFDWLHHHELGHEWWGNLVTVPDWNDFWIHEGFCSYMQKLYIEELHGRDAYLEAMQQNLPNLRNEKAVAPREPRTTSQMYFSGVATGETDPDIYQKGAYVLHTLRYLIGDEAFFTALRRMAYPDPALEAVTDGSQARFATTADFQRIAEAASGMDLGWFFEMYLRQPLLPRLVTERTDEGYTLRWETPGDLPFPMPVPVHIGGEVRRVAMPEGKATLTLGEDAQSIAFDAEQWILRVR